MKRTDFIQKINEYLEIIETAKSGEDVRDAIVKALIVIDSFSAGVTSSSGITPFKVSFGEALDHLWEDISDFYPNAVRPDPPVIDPATIMSDELEAILKSIMSSPTGTDIRSAIVAGLQNVNNSVTTQDFVTLYYIKSIDDMLGAFIEACNDEEKRSAALETRDQWYSTDIYKEYQRMRDSVLQSITQLIDVPTGLAARPLLLSTLNGLKSILLEEFVDTDIGVWEGYGYPENGKNFETVAKILIDPSEFYEYRHILSAGGPYATREQAESRLSTVISIDSDSNYDVWNATIEGHSVYYVLLNPDTTEDGWYLTYGGAYVRAYNGNYSYPGLNLVILTNPLHQGGD